MASIPEEFARAYAKAAAGKTDVVSASVANKRYIVSPAVWRMCTVI